MSTRFFRSKVLIVGVAAFAGGLFVASGMDLTNLSWAQPGSSKIQTAHGPNGTDSPGSFADVAERVTPTVVAINTVREARQVRNDPRARQVPPGMEDFFQQFGGGQPQPREMRGEGSGFIVTPDGYIITNNHVVADADRVTVTLSDQRIFTAKVVGRDSTTDVAVVKIDAKGLPTLPIGDDDKARIGDWVLAVGNPLGLDFTVTAGIISAKSRGSEIRLPNASGTTISDFIQTDAAINPGNSGGPLINLKGEAVGLNSAIASETGYYSGYGFAIPITLVKQVADALIKDGRVRLPVLGISVGAVSAEDAGINGLSTNSGVLVQGFNPADGGPAKAAGILPGDIVVAVGGQPVPRVSALQRLVRSHAVGETVTVDVLRYGAKKQFKVKLIESEAAARVSAAPTSTPGVATPEPATKALGKLGISVDAVPADLAKSLDLPAGQGVRVSDVSADSPAKDKLFPGSDIITDVLYPGPRRAINSVAELQSIVAGLKDGEYMSLMVTRFSVASRSKQSLVVNIRGN